LLAQSIQDYYQKGYDLILAENYYAAKENFNKVLDLNPRHANALYFRGITKGFLGDHQGAFFDFNKSIKLNPSNKNAYFNRAAAQVLMGKIKIGCKELRKLDSQGDKEASNFVKNHCD
jgi:tetratricopeptide (TPR) repeat protein